MQNKMLKTELYVANAIWMY